MGELVYADAIHIRKQAEVDASRKTTASGNVRRGAESELARFSASLSNRRVMDAAGTNVNAMTENISRNLEAATAGTFSARIAAAEELGASAAMASAAGVGGSSVETYNATLSLNEGMQEEQQQRHTNSDLVDASNARGAVITEATASLDNNVIRASQDFSQFVDHHKMGLLERIGTVGLAAVATYFGGPQAGSAVLGVSESRQAAANGDFAAASAALSGAVQNGIGGFKAARAAGGPVWESNKHPASAANKPSIKIK